jgi:hypothetical protein
MNTTNPETHSIILSVILPNGGHVADCDLSAEAGGWNLVCRRADDAVRFEERVPEMPLILRAIRALSAVPPTRSP